MFEQHHSCFQSIKSCNTIFFWFSLWILLKNQQNFPKKPINNSKTKTRDLKFKKKKKKTLFKKKKKKKKKSYFKKKKRTLILSASSTVSLCISKQPSHPNDSSSLCNSLSPSHSTKILNIQLSPLYLNHTLRFFFFHGHGKLWGGQ